MAQLVEHRPQPFPARHHVGQHADVALAVHVLAEGVRALARLFEKVAAGQHVVDRQADAFVKLADGLNRVDGAVDRLEVAVDGRRLLEERVLIVPRPQVGDVRAALPGQGRVDLGLGRMERPAGQGVELVEIFSTCSWLCSARASCMTWKSLKPSCRAAWFRKRANFFRSGARTGPTALLASQTALRRAESLERPQDLADLVFGQFLPADLGHDKRCRPFPPCWNGKRSP